LEVYEQLKQRMGVVIVGPPQTGKSTVCAILKKVGQDHNTLCVFLAFADGETFMRYLSTLDQFHLEKFSLRESYESR